MVVREYRNNFKWKETSMIGRGWRDKTAWDYATEREKALFGDFITNKEWQDRMSRAVFFVGGLPYMFDRAEHFRKLMYNALRLEKGNKVLIIGECLEACGFLDEVKKRLRGDGEIHAFDLMYGDKPPGTEEKRVFSYSGYINNFSEEYFDVIFFAQGVHHEENWEARAKEFIRILKKGGRIVFAEATVELNPDFYAAVQSDVHIEMVFKKLHGREKPAEWPYLFYQPTPRDLKNWFEPYLENMQEFVWKGMMLVHGVKK